MARTVDRPLFCLPFIIPERPLKNRHWLELTEYASFAGVAAGAVASFLMEKALLLSTPLSIALLVGFANRRRVEQIQEAQTESSIAALKQKLSKQIKTLDQHIKTLPTPEMVGDVRNSMLRHSRDELRQLTTKIDTINETIDQYTTLLDDQHLGGVKDEVQQLQGFYREMYGSLKRMQKNVDQASTQDESKEIAAQMAQLRSEAERVQMGLQTLTDQTQPTLSYLQEQVNHINRQNTALLQQVDASSLKRELDLLMDAVAELAPKRDLNAVMSDIRTLQTNQESHGQSEEALRKQLHTVMQRLQAVPDVPQFRAQIEETLSWQLRDINQQLRTLQNTKQFHSKVKEVLTGELDTINRQLQARSERPLYKLIFDVNTEGFASTEGSGDGTGRSLPPMLGSRQLLEEALATAKQQLILIWPWSSTLQMDKPLMKKLEAFVKSGRRLEVGWCHITASGGQRFLGAINRRWHLDSLAQRSLQLTLKYLLALKRRYPKQVKFQVMGTVENFLVADRTFAALGIEDRLTTITPLEDVSLKLWTADRAVIDQLVQTFEHTDLAPGDVESHWNRAVTRYELGDRAGAMADIEQILAVNPGSAIAHNMRGIIHFDQQDTAAALADFEQALELDNSQVSVYCNRGFLLSEQGNQYRAIADFSLAIQSPLALEYPQTLGIAYFYRGLACQKLDDFEGAIADYTNALEHIPESPVIRYHRGITYQAIDYHAAAIEDLEQAMTLFQYQNSKTNAQRAARHLQQSQAILAAQEQHLTDDADDSMVPGASVDMTAFQAREPHNHGEVTTLESANRVELPMPETHESVIAAEKPESTAEAEIAETEIEVGVDTETAKAVESAIAIPTPEPELEHPELEQQHPDLAENLDDQVATTQVDPTNKQTKAESFVADYSVATPSFLFPGENRSHPTGIENLDASMESLEDWSDYISDSPSDSLADSTDDAEVETSSSPEATEPNIVPDTQPSNESETDQEHLASTLTTPTVAIAASETEAKVPVKAPETTQASENSVLGQTPKPSPNPQSPGPQRRRKTDLDRLVTTTLTDFFDEVDLANLDAQSLGEFAAEVQTAEPVLRTPASPPATATRQHLNATSEKTSPPHQDSNQDSNQSLTLFAEDLFDQPIDNTDDLALGHLDEPGDRPRRDERDRPSISTQPTTTPPVVTVGHSASLTATDNQQVNDAGLSSPLSPSPFPSSSPAQNEPEQDEPEKLEKLVTSTLTNFFADLSDNEIQAAMSAYSAQVAAANLSETQESSHDPQSAAASSATVLNTNSGPSPSQPAAVSEDDNREDISNNALDNDLDNDLKQLINPSTADTVDTVTPDSRLDTFGNFMDSMEDSLGVNMPDDIYTDPWDEEMEEPPQPIKPPVQSIDIDEDLLAESLQTDGGQTRSLEEESQSNPSSALISTEDLPPEPTPEQASDTIEAQSTTPNQPMIAELPTPNGMELGTATLTDFMAAIEGEDLSTQTLQDFFAILNEDVPSTADDDGGESIHENGDRLKSESQEQDEIDAESFESLFNLSDRF
ncbi:MAG: tetratricopeptide repeat protein [Cyanothece sp. SIO2G6]|nr:tetratricopeptide repeat protein [Cyanothece sp. SIO2G6]